MKQNKIPCYRYPTETILVDDNKNFLKTLQFALGSRYKCRPFENPEKALSYIAQSTSQLKTAISRYIPEIEDLEDHRRSLIVDIANIHKEIYNKDRFKEIAVVVIDYGMPSMNGLDLCKKIKNTTKNPLKLIMLTGEAGYDIAVEAFNNGLINKFILKSQGEYVNAVAEAILDLQEEYFFDLSEPIRRLLQPAAQKLLETPEFIEIFNKMTTQNNIKEFYILDDSFSILFMDDQGSTPVSLIIRTEEDMDMQYELASDDRHVNPAWVEDIKNRKKLASYTDHRGINQPAQDWLFHDAQLLSKASGCYYAIVTASENSQLLDHKKIAAYQNYSKTKLK